MFSSNYATQFFLLTPSDDETLQSLGRMAVNVMIDEHILKKYFVSGFNNNNNVLPITQNLGQSQKQVGSCPAVGQVPPVSQCGGRLSNCWSVGQPDVDCIENALCCFDGCANVCQGSGWYSEGQSDIIFQSSLVGFPNCQCAVSHD